MGPVLGKSHLMEMYGYLGDFPLIYLNSALFIWVGNLTGT